MKNRFMYIISLIHINLVESCSNDQTIAGKVWADKVNCT